MEFGEINKMFNSEYFLPTPLQQWLGLIAYWEIQSLMMCPKFSALTDHPCDLNLLDQERNGNGFLGSADQ